MPMREPWDLASAFIQQQAGAAQQARASADTALLRMFATQAARTDAATGQGYALDTLAKRNEYATEADTTAFGRQKELGAITHGYDVENQGVAQRNRLEVQGSEDAAMMERLKYEQEQANKRAGMQYGDNTGGMRRFGAFTPTDAKIIQIESGGNPNAQNPLSSAGGLAQFTDTTWASVMRAHPELNLTPNGKKDPEQAKRALVAFRQDNQSYLAKHGVPINDATTYAAHFLGAGGAVQALRNPDGAAMVDVVGPGVIQANPQLRSMTVGDFKQWLSNKMGGAGNTSASTSADTGAATRRYVGDVPDPTASSTGAVQNSASAGAVDDGSTNIPVSKPFQEWLDANNMEAVQRIPLTEAQLDLLPDEMKNQLVPDMYDTTGDNSGKQKKTAYIVVRSRAEAEGTQPPAVPLQPKSATTEATPLKVQTTERPVFKDGRRWVMKNGTEVQLPD